jgi:hypothetical protein
VKCRSDLCSGESVDLKIDKANYAFCGIIIVVISMSEMKIINKSIIESQELEKKSLEQR